jgi:Holliday junction resolvase RusA-like endonuclease
MLEFFVAGKPVPKARARVVRHNGITRSYTPEESLNYELLVRYAAAQAVKMTPPHLGPMRLDMIICLPVPASWSQKKKDAAYLGKVLPTVKPDASNILKSVEDAMNNVVYKDDCQLCEISLRKVYSQHTGVRITVRPLDALPSR